MPIENPDLSDRSPDRHLAFLDGLRGATALFVLLFHSDLVVRSADGIPAFVMQLITLTGYAHYAVGVFIVLSGYCLMLPVTRSEDGRLRGGAWEYLSRRARRILPPYYAALGISLAICLIPIFHHRDGSMTGLGTDHMFPAFGVRNIIAHLLLLHNLSPDFAIKINSPLWSVAPEWQIYFFFPAVLLPVWRRFGKLAVIGAAYCLSMIPHFFFAGDHYLDWTYPWYLGLFTLGMVGAIVSQEAEVDGKLPRTVRSPWLWLGVLFTCMSVIVWIARYAAKWDTTHYYISDSLIGLSATSLILWGVLSLQLGRRPLLIRALESRPAVGLGLFSYSLYLIHFPVIGLMNQILLRLNPTPMVRLECVLFLFVPLTIAIAYGFHVIFERPFLHQRKKAGASIPALAPST